MFEANSELDKIKAYLVANLNTALVAGGLSPIDNIRIGAPRYEADKRNIGVFIHPDEGVAFESPRTDCEVVASECTFVVGMTLLSEDDDGGENGDDTLVYKYNDVLTRILGEFVPTRRGSLKSASPQLAYDRMQPDVFIQMVCDVSYEE